MTDLKPCPFCGGEASMHTGRRHIEGHGPDGVGVFKLICHECEIEQPWRPTRAVAKAAWNRRADGWISVEDELPEENHPVIVHGGIAIVDRGNWYTIMDRGLRNPERIEWTVTHWQPLPAPPEDTQ